MSADIMKTQNINGVIDPSLISTLASDRDDWTIKPQNPNIFIKGQKTDLGVSETNKLLTMWGIFFKIHELMWR
jgi:hypothetical protein